MDAKTKAMQKAAHELADAAINWGGYADDSVESDERSVRRDELEARLLAVAEGERSSVLADDETGAELAYVAPARDEAVRTVLDAPVGTGDGRSRWFWVRMRNGDLFLAVAPQGATYEGLEGEPGTGWGT